MTGRKIIRTLWTVACSAGMIWTGRKGATLLGVIWLALLLLGPGEG